MAFRSADDGHTHPLTPERKEPAMCHLHDIRPIERECICPGPVLDAPHTDACDDAFRARFFGAWRTTRSAFAQAAADQQLLDVLGGRPALN